MKILQFEDKATKQVAISRQLPLDEIESVTNLKDGINKLPGDYDLIITDMWYPKYEGGKDNQSGDELIEYIEKYGIDVPVILISSVDYRYPKIFGCIHFNDDEDWEAELTRLVNKRRQQLT